MVVIAPSPQTTTKTILDGVVWPTIRLFLERIRTVLKG
jgi:hypothetical protein